MSSRRECIKKCFITGFLTLALAIASIILIANTDIKSVTTDVTGNDTVLTVVMTDTGAKAAVLKDRYGMFSDSVNVAASTAP